MNARSVVGAFESWEAAWEAIERLKGGGFTAAAFRPEPTLPGHPDLSGEMEPQGATVSVEVHDEMQFASAKALMFAQSADKPDTQGESMDDASASRPGRSTTVHIDPTSLETLTRWKLKQPHGRYDIRPAEWRTFEASELVTFEISQELELVTSSRVVEEVELRKSVSARLHTVHEHVLQTRVDIERFAAADGPTSETPKLFP